MQPAPQRQSRSLRASITILPVRSTASPQRTGTVELAPSPNELVLRPAPQRQPRQLRPPPAVSPARLATEAELAPSLNELTLIHAPERLSPRQLSVNVSPVHRTVTHELASKPSAPARTPAPQRQLRQLAATVSPVRRPPTVETAARSNALTRATAPQPTGGTKR